MKQYWDKGVDSAIGGHIRHERKRACLIVNRLLSQPIECPIFGEDKLKRVDHARLSLAVRCVNGEAWLLGKVERLGREISPKARQAEALQVIGGLSHWMVP